MVLRREREGVLLDSLPDVMQYLGELRRMVFAYEVRGARQTDPDSEEEEGTEDAPDPTLGESLRVVEEAIERARELQEQLKRGLLADDSEDD